MTEKTPVDEKTKLQARIKKMQDKLKAMEARDREKEERRLAKVRDAAWKVMVDLGLADVPPTELKSVLREAKAAGRFSVSSVAAAQERE
jgi:sugar phosphate isomerase/epimerase